MLHLLNHTVSVETQVRDKATFHHITLASVERPEIFVTRTVPANAAGNVARADFMAVLNDLWPSWIRLLRDRGRKPLTKAQRFSYEQIIFFWSEEGRAPTQDELADMTNTSKGAAASMIGRLETAGWVWRDHNRRPVPYDLALPELR